MPVVPLKGAVAILDPKRGRWYRAGYYGANKDSHRICDVDSSIFWCGRVVWPEPDQMDMAHLDTWLLYEDERKNPKRCTACRAHSAPYDAGAAIRLRRKEQERGQALYDRVVTFDDLMEMVEANVPRVEARKALGI